MSWQEGSQKLNKKFKNVNQEVLDCKGFIEEKKAKVTDKLKNAMGKLERARSQSMGMIKENPKEARPHKEKVAHLTQKIDELMMKLEKIEMSKKAIEKKVDKNKK